MQNHRESGQTSEKKNCLPWRMNRLHILKREAYHICLQNKLVEKQLPWPKKWEIVRLFVKDNTYTSKKNTKSTNNRFWLACLHRSSCANIVCVIAASFLQQHSFQKIRYGLPFHDKPWDDLAVSMVMKWSHVRYLTAASNYPTPHAPGITNLKRCDFVFIWVHHVHTDMFECVFWCVYELGAPK